MATEQGFPQSLYDIKVKTIDGKEELLSKYKSKTLLIVNTASECGYTKQYKPLEELYQKYKNQGLVVLGFPSNDFGAQEPGANLEIKTFCETKYKTTFPLFEKNPVKGKEIQTLFQFLTQQPNMNSEVKWNFEKFLINKEGKLIRRFKSDIEPSSDELTNSIQEIL